jgi:hypothetical protein
MNEGILILRILDQQTVKDFVPGKQFILRYLCPVTWTVPVNVTAQGTGKFPCGVPLVTTF